MEAIKDTVALVLAAGKGTRMDGDMPKVLVPLDGKPLLAYILAALAKAGFSPEEVVAVVGYKHDEVLAFLDSAYRWALQKEQLGTGHAVLAARDVLQDFSGTVMILYGDVPLITDDIILDFRKAHAAGGAACSVLTAELEDPAGYGRIIRDADGGIQAIVEEREADAGQKAIREINTGFYCFQKGDLFEALGRIDNNNSKGEYYLTDVVRIMIEQKMPVNAVKSDAPDRVLGINTVTELQAAEHIIRGGQ